ncbi:MAG: aminotransferase class I/II-fold pyridoxal phosphate-dependent enzyme, partial [Oscillospiraceae bacterium]|nr:aminotransferase class I/II-fold pyridoxal phosphate-dependent enzyme [Oscillospiraceae bacterium]
MSYKPGQIVVASGARHNVYVALRTLVNPGDEIILPAPHWISFCKLIKMVGGVPVIIDCPESEHFKLTEEKLRIAVTPKTKALILTNPSNPTGILYNKDELAALAHICVENGIYVIADEICYRLVYDNRKFVSFASLGEEIKDITILINGVSKTYAMTGWRIGYAAANDKIAEIMG